MPSDTSGNGESSRILPSYREMLELLSKKLVAIRRKRADEILAIENVFGNLTDLDRFYVMPDLQDFNPMEEKNSPGLIASRQPAFEVIDEFVQRPNLSGNGHNCLFILGDAGMGKTSLLIMQKYRHLTSFLPTEHDCVLIKLDRDTVSRIEQIKNPTHTILLLDSLDEDPAAISSTEGADARLRELLPKLHRFHRVIVTCRTQFFADTSPKLNTLPGHFVFESRECPLKYLSPFTDKQVDLYLEKRYPPSRWQRFKHWNSDGRFVAPPLKAARVAAKAMDSLRLRPLLLSHIDQFVNKEGRPVVDFTNSYVVHERLVREWLRRDANEKQGLQLEESWRVATLLAIHLFRKKQRQISRDDLRSIPGLEMVSRFHIEARSLLNRTNDFHYQFAHRTVPEFLLARAILEPDPAFSLRGISLSRESFRFLQDGRKLRGNKPVNLCGASIVYEGALLDFVRATFAIEMVNIQPGEFVMGSPKDEVGRYDNEEPHNVSLTRGFSLGKYPVTQEQYQAVMGKNPSHFKGERRPVESVTWHDAMGFCNKLNEITQQAGVLPETIEFRLPTEAEWEYACRAGTASAFNDGSACTNPGGKDEALMKLSWHGEGKKGETHPVGEKLPNAWGLHDMHGNVWEWCVDRYGGYETKGQVDPEGPEHGANRVFRGGSYWLNARNCRSAYRDWFEPDGRIIGLGFRLAAGYKLRSGATGRAAGGADAPG